MSEVLCAQKNLPEKITGKTFWLGIAGIVLRMAIGQIVVNLLISLTGVGLLNILFYLYAVVLLVGFMARTVASTAYQLTEDRLTLQRLLGDSTTSVVEIDADRVKSIYPIKRGENLRLCYRQVTYIDGQLAPGIRFGAAFAVSYLSAHLTRLIAGKNAMQDGGWVVAFEEESQLRACVFAPDEVFLATLAHRFPGEFDRDERTRRDLLDSIGARSMQRAFPALYPYVKPLNSAEELQWALETEQERAEAHRQEKQKKQAEKARREKKKQAVRPAKKKPGSTAEAEDEPKRRRRETK